MPFADASGCKLFYRVDGHDDAPALVLSNSLGTTHEMWEPQMAALTERFRVVRYDRRGHGQSEATDAPYTIEGLAQDSLAVMDAAGVDKAHWCGLSIGGMIGLSLATTNPERIGKLAVASAATHMPPPEIWDGRIRTARARGLDILAQPTMQMWFTPAFRNENPDAVERIKEGFRSMNLEGFAGCSTAMRDMDQRESIRGITAPTLVIVGSDDSGTTPGDAALVVSRVADARGIILKGSHIINVEQSEAFTAALLEFLG